ncbi:hypothetical protein OG796_21610 [Streptomyces jietaisiensis]|uniref:DUF6542 domain-containing protein n=1 Tax=Streptomyces griseoaurantiacus TaxID=68213 RepID=A0ABZ1V0D7_9ACTN
MEQHRTPSARYGPRRGAPLPPRGGRRPAPAPVARGRGAGVRPAAARRPAPGAGAPARPAGARHLPNPRLTGLGGGLFAGAVMLVLGFLDRLLFGGSLTAYGALFLPVCALTALWIRSGDLLTAPVVAPIAFAVGLLPAVPGDGGLGGRLMALITALATQAGWLYGGTAVAAALVGVRAVGRRRTATAAAARNGSAARPGGAGSPGRGGSGTPRPPRGPGRPTAR